jgi:hypothetical protein
LDYYLTMPIQKMIDQLTTLGSQAIASKIKPDEVREWLNLPAQQKEELLCLLSLKNGFYAFESALHVFPFSMIDCYYRQDLLRWNSSDLWRGEYGPDAENLFFFAEDIFGYQFCFTGDRVGRFDPETGSVDVISQTLEEWASTICKDFEFHTGYQIAHDWQAANGPLREGHRLVPIIPLITREGSYALNNFYDVDAVTGMLCRAELACQIKGVADGRKIRIVPKSKSDE